VLQLQQIVKLQKGLFMSASPRKSVFRRFFSYYKSRHREGNSKPTAAAQTIPRSSKMAEQATNLTLPKDFLWGYATAR
jgi:hypothetical protein